MPPASAHSATPACPALRAPTSSMGLLCLSDDELTIICDFCNQDCGEHDKETSDESSWTKFRHSLAACETTCAHATVLSRLATTCHRLRELARSCWHAEMAALCEQMGDPCLLLPDRPAKCIRWVGRGLNARCESRPTPQPRARFAHHRLVPAARDCVTLAGALCRCEALGGLSSLSLGRNAAIGDAGVSALCSALSTGALSSTCRSLELHGVQLSDEGVEVRHTSSRDPTETQPRYGCRCSRDTADDAGMPTAQVLCSAALRGAIANCQALYLNSNFITDAGAHCLAAAMAHGAFGRLVSLWLQHNGIGDSGALCLADAIGITPGLQAGLKYLRLDENPLSSLGGQVLAYATKSWRLNRLDV